MIAVFKNLKSFWKQQETLERRLFWMILVVVFLLILLSAVMTFLEDVGRVPILFCLFAALMCAAIAVAAVKTSSYSLCYQVLFYLHACFFLPVQFFVSGGFDCGAILYFAAAFFLCSYIRGRRSRQTAFLLTVFSMYCTLFVGEIYPGLINHLTNRRDMFIDIVGASTLIGCLLFFVGTNTVKMYERERKQKNELLSKLEFLSKCDSLTGLYNRGYLLNFLEEVVWPHRENYYVLMLDMDDFKKVNVCCGHAFGDLVLRDVARCLKGFSDESDYECVARFNGAEFVYVIHSGSEIEAYAKVEKMRDAVSRLYWEEQGQLRVTFSGGFAACRGSGMSNVKLMLSKLDELMTNAKDRGKNRIETL